MRRLAGFLAALAASGAASAATVNIDDLPPAGTLTGAEILWIEAPPFVAGDDFSLTLTALGQFVRRGRPLNLKADFGASCDGGADDTDAIQAWLNSAAPGVALEAPAGTCKFTRPLTVPAASHYTIAGAGPQTTIFSYAGASATATPLTINAPNAAAVYGVTLSGFRMRSQTAMTAGFAVQANGLFASVLDNVAIDQPAYGDAYDGNWCGGIWFNGAAGIDYRNPAMYSTRKCGDGIRVNSNLGASAELRVVGGQVQGFAVGGHMAGGFGGFRFDGTNIAVNGGGVLVDNAVVAAANREFDLGSTAAVDGSDNYGVKVNDSISGGGTIDIAGWVASTKAGHGIEIDDWTNGDVQIRGNKVYNNCGSGVYVADSSARLSFSSATYINGNGASLGSACTTWKAAHPGHGYGVEATSALSTAYAVTGMPKFADNAAGPFNANSGMVQQYTRALTDLSAMSLVGAPGSAVGLTLAAGGAGNAAELYFSNGVTTYWSVGVDAGGELTLWDQANAGAWLLRCLSGGACTLGETDASALTVLGGFTVKTTAGAQARLNLDEHAGSSNAVIGFQSVGADKWTMGGNASAFGLNDKTSGSAVTVVAIAPGGNLTLGEASSNVMSVYGSVAAKAGAPTINTGTCATVGSATGGALAGALATTASCATTKTLVLSGMPAQVHGYSCDAHDLTTRTALVNQSASAATSVTFTIEGAATGTTDTIVWKCLGY